MVLIMKCTLASPRTDPDGLQLSGFMIWVLTLIKDESVPSRPRELLLGVLFLLVRENICPVSDLNAAWSIFLQL